MLVRESVCERASVPPPQAVGGNRGLLDIWKLHFADTSRLPRYWPDASELVYVLILTFPLGPSALLQPVVVYWAQNTD